MLPWREEAEPRQSSPGTGETLQVQNLRGKQELESHDRTREHMQSFLEIWENDTTS